MKTIINIIVLLACTSCIQAQSIFVSHGKIEFEKRLNVSKILADFNDDEQSVSNSLIDELKKSVPTSKSYFFDLYFDNNKILYKPGREVATIQQMPDWLIPPGNENIVYTDLEKKEYISQKSIRETSYLFQDSIRNVKWRITSDTRTVAGFECRKAVGIIMDSVYVIAFYTDEILTSGGPESFAGLPGMILGIAIPRLNTTWFATKLELEEVKPEQLAAPKKGKKTDAKTMTATLKEQFKNAPKNYTDPYVWNAML